MIKMVAVDMDGTFLKSTNEYNRPRFQRIFEIMQKKNVHFVVASGNQYYQLRSFFPGIEKQISFVAENGALVISEGEELFCGRMQSELVQRVLGFLEKQPRIQTILCGRKSAYVNKRASQSFKEHAKIYYYRLQEVESLLDVNQDVLFKFALNVPVEETKNVMKLIQSEFESEISVVSSGHGDIDLIIPGIHKANGIEVLQKKWDISKEELATFGDGGNDLEMLKHAGFGYAMANGSLEAKQTASYLAPSNDEEGVLSVLEELIANHA